MRTKNPIVIIALIGLAIIAAVAAYTLLKPEPEPIVSSAAYGYYHQHSRVGELRLSAVDTATYQFEGNFSIHTTAGRIRDNFHGELGDFRSSVPPLRSMGRSNGDWAMPFPTALDAAVFVHTTAEMTSWLPPEHWGSIDAGYSEQFTYRIPFLVGGPQLTVRMTITGSEDVVVPSGTYRDCFVVNGTQAEMGLEMTLWVTEQGLVPRAEITMDVRGIDPVTLTLKLEHYEQKDDETP
ncbi:MAG: hypothetical protein IBX67_07785 [Dehalococcoidia bacterium]|nr:hypothetical protein [Dehalococcoidia bacterium]